MILVLCDEGDASAFWAADLLDKQGLSPMVITGVELATVACWRHVVDGAGADCTVRLADGRVLQTSDTRGALNRLACVPWQWQSGVRGDDRAYALQEMSAFYLSWLYTLRGPVFNKPTPQGLCGNLRHPSAWTALAVRAGLPVRPYRQGTDADVPVVWWGAGSSVSSDNLVHVIGSRVVGPIDLVKPFGAACQRLAAAADVGLLGVEFEPDGAGGWRMCGASVAPDLMAGGEALAEALIKEFTA